VLIPVTGEPGTMAAMALGGEATGFAAATAGPSAWRNQISPGVFATVALHRPLARANRITCPLWVGLGERDVSVLKPSVQRLAQRAPHAELYRYDYDHFEPFVGDAPARIAADQLDFLQRQGLV
jgi:pimeloyl-ACP methyl ester carboxylesterase